MHLSLLSHRAILVACTHDSYSSNAIRECYLLLWRDVTSFLLCSVTLITLTMPTHWQAWTFSVRKNPFRAQAASPRQKWTPNKVRVALSKPIHAVSTRVGPTGANHGPFTARSSSCQVHRILWVTQPTPSPFQNPHASAQRLSFLEVCSMLQPIGFNGLQQFNENMVLFLCLCSCMLTSTLYGCTQPNCTVL